MNTQPIEGRVRMPVFDVHSIFQTLQGEGPSTGMPAVFIRLAGCNLQCPLCDTDYTSERRHQDAAQIVKAVEGCRSSPTTRLVVITGGEPFRQTLWPLVAALSAAGFIIEIETNGTFSQPNISTAATIICSPKAKVIHKDLIPQINAYKYVLQDGHIDAEDGLPTSVLGNRVRVARPPEMILKELPGSIYVQPAEDRTPERTSANLAACVSVCLRYGYTLSLQTHKILNLP